MDRLTPAQLEAIVDHEMCHVRRRDNLTAAIHMWAETLFWFYPLLWWIRSRLLEERERACDEEVLQLGNDREIYVEGILSVCKFYCESTLACASGISGSDLKKRIARILIERQADSLSLSRKVLLAAAGLAAAAGPVIYGIVNIPQLSAQVSPKASIESQPSFEVASIKLSRSGDTHSHIETPAGRFIARSVTTKLLIEYAYDLRKIQLAGGPSWIDSEKYDVDAKMGEGSGAVRKPDPDDPSEELRVKLRSLLQDRFRLGLASQTKELPIYALVVAKNGPKLQEATVPPGHMLTTRNGQITAKGAPVRALAAALSGRLDRMVLDKTGLTGIYDFTLQWAPDEAGMLKSASDPQVSPGATQPDFSGPSIFTAVQEQLGLKLESQKGPVKILVIDHVEKPSEN